jgi:hypothetical protein
LTQLARDGGAKDVELLLDSTGRGEHSVHKRRWEADVSTPNATRSDKRSSDLN